MKHQALYFMAPRCVEIHSEEQPQPLAGQVLVRAICSAISPGTEMLFYRGSFVPDLPMDSIIEGLTAPANYPIKYGYSMVGEVQAVGEGVAQSWLGRRVFVFHPHENLFCAAVDSLMPVPDAIASEDAIFLPNMETAVNFVMDAAPVIGERAVVFGQGIIGLLTTALLGRFPLGDLVTLDCFPLRRQASLDAGAHSSMDPDEQGVTGELKRRLKDGADLTFEISGSPRALNQALEVTGFAGRVIFGSWYGSRPATLNLGGDFHRSRIRLLSSQVSTLDPSLSARWDKVRRFELAWRMIAELRPSRWITHTFPLAQAAEGYQLIDQQPEQTIQVTMVYD